MLVRPHCSGAILLILYHIILETRIQKLDIGIRMNRIVLKRAPAVLGCRYIGKVPSDQRAGTYKFSI